MLMRRLIVCLDVDGGTVVKGTRFVNLRRYGAPNEMASMYERDGADEIVFLDISASVEARRTLLEDVTHTADGLTIPLTVGGGVRSVRDLADTLRAGADKVAVNTAAVARPELIAESAAQFGSQCVVLSIDARRHGERWIVVTHGGRQATSLDAVEWAQRAASLGAGEVLLTSVDRDGTQLGYDLELTRVVAEAVSVPVIASGGAGEAAHLVDAFTVGAADAVLVAGILHRGEETVAGLKRYLAGRGIVMRDEAMVPDTIDFTEHRTTNQGVGPLER